MAPVALAIANDLGASPYPFAMIVALAASAAFHDLYLIASKHAGRLDPDNIVSAIS